MKNKETLTRTLLELRDRLVMGQDSAGNASINADEIELINKAIKFVERAF